MATREKRQLISHLLKETIVQLCKSNELYHGRVEVDGIICISGQVEGQELIVKVHESFMSPSLGVVREGAPLLVPRFDASLDWYRRDSDALMGLRRKRRRLEVGEYDFGGVGRLGIAQREKLGVTAQYPYFGLGHDATLLAASADDVARNLSMKRLISIAPNSNGTETTTVINDIKRTFLLRDTLSSPRQLDADKRQDSLSVTSPGGVDQDKVIASAAVSEAGSSPTTNTPVCKLCECTFESVDALSEHNETVHSVHTCVCCFKTFTSRSNLERHSRLHTGHRPFTCGVCGKSFSRRDHLSNHATKHAYKCGACSCRCPDRAALSAHCLVEHSASLAEVCTWCNKGFCTQDAYEEHAKVHPQYHAMAEDLRQRRNQWDDTVRTETVSYSCDYCSFTTVDLPIYLSHEKTHAVSSRLGQEGSTEEPGAAVEEERDRILLRDDSRSRRFACLMCPETFDDAQHYTEHLYVHRRFDSNVNMTGFECCVCRQVCATASILQQHEAMHVYQMSAFPSALATASLTTRLTSLSAVSRTSDVLRCDNPRVDIVADNLRVSPVDYNNPVDDSDTHANDHRRYLDNYPRHADVDIVIARNGHDATSPRILTNQRRDKRKQKLPKAITADKMKTSGSDVETESPDDLRIVARRPEAALTPEEGMKKYADWTDGDVEIKTEPMVRSIISNRPSAIFSYHHSKSKEHVRGDNQRGLDLTRNGKYEPPERPTSVLSSHRVVTPPLRPDSSLKSVSPSFRPSSSLRSDASPSGGSPSVRPSSSASFTPGASPFCSLRPGSPYRDRSTESRAALTPDSVKLVISGGSDSVIDEDSTTINNNNNNNYCAASGEKERLSVEFPLGGPYSCSVCNEGMDTWDVLEAHCLSEHSRNPCRYCSKTFAQKANRDRHMCLHTGDKPYGCPDCDERFSRGDKLKMHRIRTHGIQYPIYASRHRGDRSSGKDENNVPSTTGKGRSSAAAWLNTASNSSPLYHHQARTPNTDHVDGFNGFLSRWMIPEGGWGNVAAEASSSRSCWGEFGRYVASPSIIERRAASAQPGGGEANWTTPSPNLKYIYPNMKTTDDTLKVNDS